MTFSPIPAPLYQRIFAVLSQRISSGEYAAGARLATEDELRAEFEVSKATVRRAVDELVARGLVVRRQGSGTFVREVAEESADGFVGTLADLIVGTPQLPLKEVEVAEGVPFPRSVQQALGTDAPDGIAYRTTRLWGDKPFVYSVHYVSPLIEDVVSRAGLVAEGLLQVLHREQIQVSGASQTVSAQLADVEVAKQLNIGLGAAVLCVQRILYSSHGPIDCMHSWYRGDLYQWSSELSVELVDGRLVVAPPLPQQSSQLPLPQSLRAQ